MSYYLTREQRWNDLASGLVGFLDIIAGVLIYLSRNYDFGSNPTIIFLSFFYFTLAIWTLGINIKRKKYLEWKGIIDMVSAVCLFLVFSGNVFEAFGAIGIVIVIKGVLGLFLITTSKHS
jgi:hypothetical protein